MNKRVILFHLTEAAEQLNKTIENIRNDPEYEIGDYRPEMSHLYHHLNTAWNGRNLTEEEHHAADNFAVLRKFPTNLDLLLE
jgi:hypothetical protein